MIWVFFTVCFLGVNVLAYTHAKAMMCFTTVGDRTAKPEALHYLDKAKTLLFGVTIPRPSGGETPVDVSLDAQVSIIDGPGSIKLEAWYCDQGEDTPLVILFHGYAAKKTSLILEAQELYSLGTSVLLVDFRGSGGSSESYTTIGISEADDVVAVLEYAHANLAHPRTVLYGQSMGAVAILRAIHVEGILPDAVIVEAVFDRMLNTVRNRFRSMGVPSFPCAELLLFWGGKQAGFDGFSHNPVNYASSVTCPILFMHGKDDPRATLEEGRRVYHAVKGGKEFVSFDKTAHEPYLARDPRKWRKAINDFLQSVENDSRHKPPNTSYGRM